MRLASSPSCVLLKGTSGGAVVLTTNKGSIAARRQDNLRAEQGEREGWWGMILDSPPPLLAVLPPLRGEHYASVDYRASCTFSAQKSFRKAKPRIHSGLFGPKGAARFPTALDNYLFYSLLDL